MLQKQHNIKKRIPSTTPVEKYIEIGCHFYTRPIPGVPFVILWRHCFAQGEAVCWQCEEACDVVHKLEPKNFATPAMKRSAKTNAELASELGISKRQVAKLRKRGEIK